MGDSFEVVQPDLEVGHADVQPELLDNRAQRGDLPILRSDPRQELGQLPLHRSEPVRVPRRRRVIHGRQRHPSGHRPPQ